MNLGLNAADAMPDGGVLTLETSLLDIESDAELAPGRYMKMSVNDSGCGMDEETQQHIFEPFFSTKGERGTGLGLATVFGIVKQHGGNVLVDSTPGVGSRFDIYLPITERVAQPVAINSEQNVELKGSETILLVEDNGQLRQMAQTILLLQGYKVLTAKDGHEALVMLNTHPDNIDLLLTDVVMPGMNGKQLYEVARNNQPGLKVIYMSGYSHDVIADRGALHGEVHFIQKPFSTHDLGMIVRKTLDES
jgi:CheY-like chemotaxis protein